MATPNKLNKRKVLETLSLAALKKIVETFEVSGLSSKTKSEVVDGLMKLRSIKLADVLMMMSRKELKTALETYGMSTRGREKALLRARIEGREEAYQAELFTDAEADLGSETKRDNPLFGDDSEEDADDDDDELEAVDPKEASRELARILALKKAIKDEEADPSTVTDADDDDGELGAPPNLTPEERESVVAKIQGGQPIPASFKAKLFPNE